MALQGDTCTTHNFDFKHIVAVATGKSDEEIIADIYAGKKLPIKFNDDQLNRIEADLNQHHSSERVQYAMHILREVKFNSSTVVSDAIFNAIFVAFAHFYSFSIILNSRLLG